jgi:FKBP-type peptidyl-prolyl cis-trans isomerase
MRRINPINLKIVAIAVITVIATSCGTRRAVESRALYVPVTSLDSVCYAVGINYGSSLRDNLKTFPGGVANHAAVAEGFYQGVTGDTLAFFTAESAREFIQAYIAEYQSREAEKDRQEGEAFLAENKTKEGVITTESGLQYKILTRGTGETPVPEEQVKVHYTGRLLNGTVFDSSVERGEPLTIGLTQVSRGWTEVLQLMPVGSKYQVWIPSELGYGTQGAGQIRPNSALEFEIELLEVVKPPEP